MKILFLGGTQFVGRHMVDKALQRGHQVTLFNRGKTNADLFPDVEKILGDRDGGLSPLAGHTWDVVVDVNGYVPRLVKDSVEALKGSIGQYVFVSTGSVYDFAKMQANGDESSPLQVLEDETTEDWMSAAYGGLKVLCEKVVTHTFPDSSLILRLGVVAGPYDPTDRMTYWFTRVARGGEMLVPGVRDRLIQFIDGRDLAAFTVQGIDKGLHGIYNTIGNSITWDHLLRAAETASGSHPDTVWIDDLNFITEHLNNDYEKKMFGPIPGSVPAEFAHVWTMRSDKALDDGMVYRSTLNTARDVLAWDKTRPTDEVRVAGLDSEQEQAVLKAWKER